LLPKKDSRRNKGSAAERTQSKYAKKDYKYINLLGIFISFSEPFTSFDKVFYIKQRGYESAQAR
jgi:hypothetical protein